MVHDRSCETTEGDVKVYTPERRLIAVGTMKIRENSIGRFFPNARYQPPQFKLDLSAQPTVFAEAGSKQYELHNWRVGLTFLGANLHFEFQALCERTNKRKSR